MEPVTLTLLSLAGVTAALALTTKGNPLAKPTTNQASPGELAAKGDSVMVGPATLFQGALPFDANKGLIAQGGGPLAADEKIESIELLVTDATNTELQGVTTGFIANGPRRTAFIAVPEHIPTKFFSRGFVLSATRNGNPLGGGTSTTSSIGALVKDVATRAVTPGGGTMNVTRPTFSDRSSTSSMNDRRHRGGGGTLRLWNRPFFVSDYVYLTDTNGIYPRAQCVDTVCGLWHQTAVGQGVLFANIPQNTIVTVVGQAFVATVNNVTDTWIPVRLYMPVGQGHGLMSGIVRANSLRLV